MTRNANRHSTFRDALVSPSETGFPDRFFDRFMFNLHPATGVEPSVIVGFGMYPVADIVDGFVVLTEGGEQRNLRFSTVLSATTGEGAGPLRYAVVAPNETWRLSLGPNPIDVEFELTWQARTAPWFGQIGVANDDATPTSFDHLFQSGRYDGTLTIDGVPRSVHGWYGQRDRSRGVRTMSGGQGLHLWFQAQFATYSVGFLLVETRSHAPLLLEGAVMHEDGAVDPIVDVRHALNLDENLDLVEGVVAVITESGQSYTMTADGRAGGGFMAGAGYGGHHGVSRGFDVIEADRYLLDGSVNPRTLDSALTDRLCQFSRCGESGNGIFEFALTRHPSYRYAPTI